MKTPRETKRISFRTDVECNSSRAGSSVVNGNKKARLSGSTLVPM